MAELGADYSWARPGGAALRAAGVSAVGRYLATDPRGITAAEYADLQAHGIGVWLCREGAANGMLGGFAKGVADARIAQQQIAQVGLPANSVVYATADFDVQPGQFAVCDDYLRGFASVIGLSRTGIYGGMRYMNHANSTGVAKWFWQAGATSWDHGERPQMTIHLHQTTKTPPLPGTDHNYVLDTTTLAGESSAPIGTDDDEMLSQEAQDWLTKTFATKSDVRRENRGRLYYCPNPPAGLPQFVVIFINRNPGAGNVLYCNAGEGQARNWLSLYGQTADTVEQAKATPDSPEQYQTRINLALGIDSAFTNAAAK